MSDWEGLVSVAGVSLARRVRWPPPKGLAAGQGHLSRPIYSSPPFAGVSPRSRPTSESCGSAPSAATDDALDGGEPRSRQNSASPQVAGGERGSCSAAGWSIDVRRSWKTLCSTWWARLLCRASAPFSEEVCASGGNLSGKWAGQSVEPRNSCRKRRWMRDLAIGAALRKYRVRLRRPLAGCLQDDLLERSPGVRLELGRIICNRR